MAETHRLSQTALDRLREEHHDLTTRGRISIAEKIEEARLLGDLSENGDYHAAKEEQGKMEGRIRHLESVIENSEVIDVEGSGVVTHGAVVEIRYEGDDTTESLLFGSIEERHDDLDIVSPGSPLGLALEGHRSGDTVSYEAPGGELAVHIVSVHL